MRKIDKQDVVDFLARQYDSSRIKPDDITYEVLRQRLGVSYSEVKRLIEKAIRAGILVRSDGIRNGKYVARFNPVPGWEKKANGKNIFTQIQTSPGFQSERDSKRTKKKGVRSH